MRLFTVVILSCIFSSSAIAQSATSKQINRIGVTINKDVSTFTNGLALWSSGTISDAAATQLVKATLIPTSNRLNHNYAKTLKLTKRVPNEFGSAQVNNISKHGSKLFADWFKTLRKMITLQSQNKQKQLEDYAQKNLRPLGTRTTQFIQQTALISQQLQNRNSYAQQPQVASGRSAMRERELYRNMSNIQNSINQTSQVVIDNMSSTPVNVYDSYGSFLYTE